MKCPYCIKICSKCKRLLVANIINFPKRKDGKYGLRAECRLCRRNLDKKHRENNKEKIDEYYKQWKQNNLEYFNKYQENYRKENKENKKKIDRQYYEEHKEEILEYHKQYYEDNKKEILEKCKQYREKHKEEITEYKKQWCKDNPDKLFNASSRRRHNKEYQGDGISKEQWFEMMEFFDWRCAYSGEYLGGDSEYRTIDHIIPLNNGGKHEVWNCVPMIKNYNSSKHDKDMLDWYKQQDFYSEERLNKIYEWIEYAKNKYQNN